MKHHNCAWWLFHSTYSKVEQTIQYLPRLFALANILLIYDPCPALLVSVQKDKDIHMSWT